MRKCDRALAKIIRPVPVGSYTYNIENFIDSYYRLKEEIKRLDKSYTLNNEGVCLFVNEFSHFESKIKDLCKVTGYHSEDSSRDIRGNGNLSFTDALKTKGFITRLPYYDEKLFSVYPYTRFYNARGEVERPISEYDESCNDWIVYIFE